QHAVKPTVELETDRVESADEAKGAGAVKRDRGGLRRIPDHRDHLPEAARLRVVEQALEQRASDAATLRLRRDIDRILDSETIGRPRAIGTGIGVARDGAGKLCHQKRIAAGGERGLASRHLGRVRRLGLERGSAMPYRMGIDARDRSVVAGFKRADGKGHQRTGRRTEHGKYTGSLFRRLSSVVRRSEKTKRPGSSPGRFEVSIRAARQ